MESTNDPPLSPYSFSKSKLQIDPQVADRCEALSLAAARITESVRNERQRRSDAVVLEPGARAVPVSQQVLARQDQLEGQGPTERVPAGLLNILERRPQPLAAKNRQDRQSKHGSGILCCTTVYL